MTTAWVVMGRFSLMSTSNSGLQFLVCSGSSFSLSRLRPLIPSPHYFSVLQINHDTFGGTAKSRNGMEQNGTNRGACLVENSF